MCIIPKFKGEAGNRPPSKWRPWNYVIPTKSNNTKRRNPQFSQNDMYSNPKGIRPSAKRDQFADTSTVQTGEKRRFRGSNCQNANNSNFGIITLYTFRYNETHNAPAATGSPFFRGASALCPRNRVASEKKDCYSSRWPIVAWGDGLNKPLKLISCARCFGQCLISRYKVQIPAASGAGETNLRPEFDRRMQ